MVLKRNTLNVNQLFKLHKLRVEEKKTWEQIGEAFSKTGPAMRLRFSRVQWDEFLKDPKGYLEEDVNIRKKRWSDAEMLQLDAYLQSDKSYIFIAEKLGRTITSVERQAQETDWKAWRSIRESQVIEGGDVNDDLETQKMLQIDQYVTALLEVCRKEFERINKITQEEFLKRVNLDKDNMIVSFAELKKRACDNLIERGLGNPSSIDLEAGRYIIVGDSHGKFTKKDMFALLKKMNGILKPKKIIHIGHMLDDDNDISYEWGSFDNLIVLARQEELKIIHNQSNKFKFHYQIVRDVVKMGSLLVFNQDMISDYVKSPITSLDAEIFDGRAIVNCHRQEFATRCSNEGASYIASPGCLCEHHIIRTIKQIDFEDGRIVKQANHDGFIKYRRMKHTNKYWEQGLLVVEVDEQDNHTIIPCPIRKTSKGFTTSYFDKMITSKGVFKPDKKIFVNCDMHCDLHDVNILDVQEQICKDYKPDIQVNLGDTFNYYSLNHHIMDRGGVILDKKILDEAAHTNYILRRVATWAKESHLIFGNHERFANDFAEKYPQFGQYLDFRFICDLKELGYKLTDLKNILKIGPTKFAHGEIRMFGQTGSKLEKASRTFGKDIFIGHIHRPAVRFGCYSVGLTGRLDQHYNEPDASNWLHGFGLCNHFKGKSWPTTVAIVENKCVLGGKTYEPGDTASWKMPSNYKVKISYDF